MVVLTSISYLGGSRSVPTKTLLMKKFTFCEKHKWCTYQHPTNLELKNTLEHRKCGNRVSSATNRDLEIDWRFCSFSEFRKHLKV